MALSLVFVGGAVGKSACGWLGARLGLAGDRDRDRARHGGRDPRPCSSCRWRRAWQLLPPLGAMLNGTSSVLYGTVPELVPAGRIEHAFALFYTGRS